MLAEKAVLSRILFNNELSFALDRRVSNTVFQDAECKRCFGFILDFYKKYGKIPSLELIDEEFKGLKIEYVKEPIDFYLDKVVSNYVRVEGTKLLMDSAKSITENPLQSLEKLQTGVASIGLEAEPTKDDTVELSIDTRKERYLRMKNLGGMDGFPTPWEVLNEVTRGLHAGDFIAIVSRPGIGKEQPLDSKLYGPAGVFTMGEAAIGKQVFGKDGKAHTITGVYPQGVKQSYRITFSDGSSTECGIDHLWTVRHRRKKVFVTMTLRELVDSNLMDGDHSKWVLPMVKPVQFPEKLLILDPYVVGCLLGDGCMRGPQPSLCNVEEDVREKFTEKTPHGVTVAADWKTLYVLGIRKELEQLGMFGKYSYEKNVPVEYLYGSVDQRIALLQGLYDCDGYTTPCGCFQYSTSSEQLCKDIMFLVESLGGTATVKTKLPKYTHNGEKRQGKLSFVLTLSMSEGVKCYSSKKHGLRDVKEGRLSPYRNIVSVEPVGMKEMCCIMVDAPDHLYVTDHFVVTHNTFLLTIFAETACKCGLKVLFVNNEMSNESIMQRFDAVHFKLPYKELSSGLLPDLLEKKYFEGLDSMGTSVRMTVTQDVQGIMSIADKIDQYNPDVVLIDGMYLIDDDRRSTSKWEGVTNVSRDLKKMARKKKVPIIATTQFNRVMEGVQMDKVTLANLGFSDSIGQDADVVMGLFRTKDMEANAEMKIRLLKVREGEAKDFMLQWDLHRMMFNVLDTESDDRMLDDENESFDY